MDLMSIQIGAPNVNALMKNEEVSKPTLSGTTAHSETATGGGCNQGWIADGICDDTNINLDCTYD